MHLPLLLIAPLVVPFFRSGFAGVLLRATDVLQHDKGDVSVQSILDDRTADTFGSVSRGEGEFKKLIDIRDWDCDREPRLRLTFSFSFSIGMCEASNAGDGLADEDAGVLVDKADLVRDHVLDVLDALRDPESRPMGVLVNTDADAAGDDVGPWGFGLPAFFARAALLLKVLARISFPLLLL